MRLALAVILVASWAIVMQVTVYLRAEDARRAAESEAARLEGARLTASAMQDRIANKLSLTVGYAEFLVTDPRLPDDLREHAQKAMDGAQGRGRADERAQAADPQGIRAAPEIQRRGSRQRLARTTRIGCAR